MIKVEYKNKLYVLEERDFQKLHSKNFAEKIGKYFVLNKFEVLYLLEKEKIEIANMKFDDIIKLEKIDLNVYHVYKDLKVRGYNVRSGTKYGFDFRVYDKNSKGEHAFWLVLVVKDTEKMKISDIAGKCRISHSTKKSAIFAVIDKDFDITYYEHSWIKM